MDGYIKNKKAAVASERTTILYKYAVSLLILVFVPIWLLGLFGNQPPEKWTHTEIVFSHISKEKVGARRGKDYVLNARDGRKFLLQAKYVDGNALSSHLQPGDTYQIVFSEIVPGYRMEALYSETETFQKLEDSVLQWEKEHNGFIIALIVNLGLEAIALILIDRLWCKPEYAKIKKLKADIQRRKERFANK